MRRAILVALGTGAIITSAAAIGIGAALTPPPGSMSRAEYEAALAHDRWLHGLAAGRCEGMRDSEADLCRAQVEADSLVRVAQVEADFRRTEQAARAALRAHIDARYLVERARCEALKGLRKDKCMIAAHAAKGRALLEASAPYEARF